MQRTRKSVYIRFYPPYWGYILSQSQDYVSHHPLTGYTPCSTEYDNFPVDRRTYPRLFTYLFPRFRILMNDFDVASRGSTASALAPPAAHAAAAARLLTRRTHPARAVDITTPDSGPALTRDFRTRLLWSDLAAVLVATLAATAVSISTLYPGASTAPSASSAPATVPAAAMQADTPGVLPKIPKDGRICFSHLGVGIGSSLPPSWSRSPAAVARLR